MKNKKYNIILSQNLELQVAIAYYKSEDYEYNFGVNPSATFEDLQNEKYQFIEDEINILKNYGNETLKKVIEFGKVEVTDDKN